MGASPDNIKELIKKVAVEEVVGNSIFVCGLFKNTTFMFKQFYGTQVSAL